ncbi:MAG: hypothetical protein MUF54_21355, partial [Polyangiaceae bacterium]|nr:hypothetical protein [Polyangiaceae bacterium]
LLVVGRLLNAEDTVQKPGQNLGQETFGFRQPTQRVMQARLAARRLPGRAGRRFQGFAPTFAPFRSVFRALLGPMLA